MKLSATLALLGLGGAALGLPTELQQRDEPPCYPETMQKGKAYTACPGKKFTLDSHGRCTSGLAAASLFIGPKCYGYCEQSLTVTYGSEVPFSQGFCQNATVCTVAQSETVTITNTYTLSLGLSLSTRGLVKRQEEDAGISAAIDVGASYSWSKSVAYTTTNTKSKTLDAKTCGYWTFIPYIMKSCGVMSGGNTIGSIDRLGTCAPNGRQDNNYCSYTPFKDSNGFADGEIIFVYVDCSTGNAKKDGQDPAYNWPGVAANSPLPVQSVIDAIESMMLAGLHLKPS